MSHTVEEQLEQLKKDINILQDTVKVLLANFSETLQEFPQTNAYRYTLNSDITSEFKGVLTFIPIHFSKDPTTVSSNTELVLKHSDGSSDVYTLVTVNSQGLRRAVRAGDIIANRPCQVILLSKSYAMVLNPASVFLTNATNIASAFTEEKESANLAEDIARLDREMTAVKEDLAKALPKIIIGTGKPSEVLKDSEDNTVYFRIEEGI